jgi:hypothetical protein
MPSSKSDAGSGTDACATSVCPREVKEAPFAKRKENISVIEKGPFVGNGIFAASCEKDWLMLRAAA